MQDQKVFKVLSLSGGGYLGLYSIAILARIEEHYKVSIANYFNLLAGTSIGGIIALGLAAEIPASKILRAFEEHGERIFSNKRRFKRLYRSKYDNKILREVVEDLIGSETLIGDLKHPVIIPTLNLSKGEPQVFKTPHHKDFKLDKDLKVADVALATSAAPTYFPLTQINNSYYTDGGVYANSPDIMAMHEAEHFFKQPLDDIYHLSIGTTSAKYSLPSKLGADIGLWNWGKRQRLLNVLLSGQQQLVDFLMQHKLGKRYLRLDSQPSKEQQAYLTIDNSSKSAVSDLKALADDTFAKNINNDLLASFFKTDCKSKTFFK